MRVKNVSKTDGDEVVQLYVRKDGDHEGPRMALRGFKRVHIPAGKSVKVRIPLDGNTFETYNESTGEMSVSKGRYSLLYGPSSDTNLLKTKKIRIRK